MPLSGTTPPTRGPELLVEIDRDGGEGLRRQLENALRDGIRTGRLRARQRLPSTRTLARDLGVSRRLVVEAYELLIAEGYLMGRPGSGTHVAESRASAPAPAPPVRPRVLAYDFFPGTADLAGFPRAAWGRTHAEVLREAPAHVLGYPDPRGAPGLREALADHLRRVRGLAVEPERIVVCAGASHGLWLLARALSVAGPALVAMEEPSLPPHRRVLLDAGARVVSVEVDEAGLSVAGLRRTAATAVVVTPAHQFPTGVGLSPQRRGALVDWARAPASGRLIVEDDYDAEFRYDRTALGALQGLAPEQVAYVGSASKTLAPGLRLGWLVVPAHLLDEVVALRRHTDMGSPVLEQLTFAALLTSTRYDRHLRQARRRHRARRRALMAALAQALPRARLSGLDAGLHAVVDLGEAVDERELSREAARRSVGLYPLSAFYAGEPRLPGRLVLGYANHSEEAIGEGVRRLAQAVAEVRRH